MNWIRNSPLRSSFESRRRPPSNSPPKDCDPTACFNSFKEHWLQTNVIIGRTEPPNSYPIQDDVLAVVNHLDHMATLLLLEMQTQVDTQHECLDFLLCENVLERLFEWSVHTGRYCNLLRSEQMKLYEMLAGQARQQLLLHQPFLRPLLRLLASCQGEMFPAELEDRLVVLLNQLCVCLMHNTELLRLFFQPSQGTDYAPDSGGRRFVIAALLVPLVHRRGAVGQQARDALLLCMTLSKQHDALARSIAHDSVCPLLATGLSGLYSRLPRKLPFQSEDWHCLTQDNVQDIEELAAFVNGFELCNAVAQVAHHDIRQQLLDFITHGFLVPVLGPALVQSTCEELCAATAYVQLCVRRATEPGLLRPLLCFLLSACYDGERLLAHVVQRLHATSKVGLASLALLDALVALCCEDVVLELALRPLVPCTHVMLSQRKRVRERDPHAYGRSALKLLSLAPACCCPHAHPQTRSLPACVGGGGQWESLYGNYHAYLLAARTRLAATALACRRWAHRYDGEDPPPDALLAAEGDGAGSGSSGYESLAPAPAPADRRDTSPHIGPFLDALLRRLENFHRNSLAVNLQLTGLISRLACFPQPLLHSFLLNQSLVFQPSIRSLFQVLSSLKHKTDAYLANKEGVEELVLQAQEFLINREERLSNTHRATQDATSIPNANHRNNHNEAFSRGDTKRRSLTSAFSSVFRRATQSALPAPLPIRESRLESDGEKVRFIPGKNPKQPVNATDRARSELQQVVLQAVLLDEWLKELAAITQEQALAGDFCEP